MKKLCLILGLMITLVACGNSEKEPQETPVVEDEQQEQTEEQEEYKLPDPIVKVTEIAGKTREEVKQIIGDENPVEDGEKNVLYNDGEIDVYYVDNKAAKITVKPKDTCFYYMQDQVLALIGLDWQSPDEESDIFTEWLYIDDIYEVRSFSKNNNNVKLDYIYVITDEIYK